MFSLIIVSNLMEDGIRCYLIRRSAKKLRLQGQCHTLQSKWMFNENTKILLFSSHYSILRSHDSDYIGDDAEYFLSGA